MKILFDQGVPVPLRRNLEPNDVETVYERDWSVLRNGDLIARAESEGFDLLVTTDQNLKYQQNLTQRRIAIVVLCSTSWPRIQKAISVVRAAVESAKPGIYVEVPIP